MIVTDILQDYNYNFWYKKMRLEQKVERGRGCYLYYTEREGLLLILHREGGAATYTTQKGGAATYTAQKVERGRGCYLYCTEGRERERLLLILHRR